MAPETALDIHIIYCGRLRRSHDEQMRCMNTWRTLSQASRADVCCDCESVAIATQGTKSCLNDSENSVYLYQLKKACVVCKYLVRIAFGIGAKF